MSFVKGYEHCVFVSYASVDNIRPVGAETGWVETLVQELRRALAEELGRLEYAKIWMDYQLGPNDSLTPTIIEAIEKSAVLLIILSPGYLESQWCKLERNAFLEKLNLLQDSKRIFLVEKKAIDKDDKPESIRDIRGLPFWFEDPVSKCVETLGMPYPVPEHMEYYSKVGDLGHHLALQLKKMNKTVFDSAQESSLKNSTRRVMLADVTDDLQDKRTEVKRYLEQHGIEVVEEEDERNPEKLSNAIEKKLQNCKLFVQLLSQLSGKSLSDDFISYPFLRYSAAKKSNTEILQWYSPNLKLDDLADTPQKQLLLEETVISESIEQFKERIVRQMDKKESVEIVPEHTEKMIFINHANEDSEFAKQVCDFVINKMGWAYALPLTNGRPAEIRGDLERNVKESDSMFLLYGDVPETWVREQLIQFRKLKGGAKKFVVLFEGPPPDKNEIGMRLPGMKILDFRDGFEQKKAELIFSNMAVA